METQTEIVKRELMNTEKHLGQIIWKTVVLQPCWLHTAIINLKTYPCNTAKA